MLLVYGLLGLIFQLLLAPFVISGIRKYRKSNNETRTVEKCKSAKLSRWTSLKITVSMFFLQNKPNYEMSDTYHKSMGNVIMIDLQTAKEVLITVADLGVAKQIMSSVKWISRFRDGYYMFKCTFGKPYGLLFGGGEYWKQARTLTLRILHQLQFYNQDKMERLVELEIDEITAKIYGMIEEQGKRDGSSGKATFMPHRLFQVHALNLVSHPGWSERFDNESYFMMDIIGAGNEMNRTFNVGFGFLEVLPWLRHLPDLTFYGPYKRANDIIVKYFMNVLKERREKGSYRTNPTDLTDYFLLEIEKRADEQPSIINDEAYCIAMRDIVWAGTDTTNSALEHGILQMALRPEIQGKVRAEIDNAIGPHRVPTYADRNRMNYTQAVLLEILRYSCPVPMTSRSPLEDTTLRSDYIPKGSLCGINLYAIHRSEDLWSDPYVFRPERFLGENGEIVNADKIIPFGFGKRLCIGESLARTFLFMTFVTLLQRFTFELSPSHPEPSLRNLPGISRCPVPYYVTARTRTMSSEKATLY